ADGDGGATAALVALGRQDLVVVAAQVQAGPGPRVEVVADGDGAAGPLLLAHAPELLERPGALDGGRVVPPGLVDVVRAAVGGDCALVGAGGPVGAPALDDVVLDQRVPGPAVQREVGVARRVEGGVVGHGPPPAGGPALTGDKVPGVPPLGAVAAARVEGHRDGPGRVGPERVEVPVVVPGLVLRDRGVRVGRTGQQGTGDGRSE